MNVIDSSLWLEYFSGKLKNNIVVDIIENSAIQYVPSICIYEVFKRMLIDKDESAALSSTAFMQNATVISIDSKIAVLAAKLGKEHKLPMADSIIYATAKLYGAKVYTQDVHFANLDQVCYFAKSPE
ncbi:MAG: type II toxin-antitoxin system VapC family toxin [Fibromonadales bacterium]|nr:type II toxin-antitoxin system VapC family toxin [Fibromonadales bacterium]